MIIIKNLPIQFTTPNTLRDGNRYNSIKYSIIAAVMATWYAVLWLIRKASNRKKRLTSNYKLDWPSIRPSPHYHKKTHLDSNQN